MKNIFILLLIVISLHANTEPCKTDVYFGNGVWNTKEQAEDSMKDMFKFLKEENPNYFSLDNYDISYSIKHMLNETNGKIEDLIETYWQLYISGQVREGYFSFVTKVLNIVDFNFDYQTKIKDIVNNYHLNLTEMYAKYRKESFDLKHNVLLVAHSRGNLFGNQLYNTLSPEEKKKFTMVSVGTPASHVLGNTSSSSAPYTTLNGDYLIKSISGSLPSNADGLGHTFVDSYLNHGNLVSRANIIHNINDAVNLLDQNICPKEYDYYRFISYACPAREDQELIVDIYGTFRNSSTNTVQGEEYVASDVRVRALLNQQQTATNTAYINGSTSSVSTGSCPLTSDDYRASASKYDKNGCSAYTFADTSLEYCNSQSSMSGVCNLDINKYALEFVSENTYSSIATCSTYDMDDNVQSLLELSSKYH